MFIEKLGLSREELKDKVALVTGAGRGIGKELAKALAWLGAEVIIAEINDTGKEVESEILSEGFSALFIQIDVSNEKDISRLQKQVMKKYGKVDILINNAIVYTVGSLSELSIEEWDRAYNVNIRGAMLLTKTFLSSMIERNSGVINFVTSAEGMPFMAPYFASKTALASIGHSLAAELEDTGISVFIFGPGMVDTPGLQYATKELAPKLGMMGTEFLNMGGNPGYDGPMPADHCAAGWAYTIVHAKDYHGQIAEPFGILLGKGLTGNKKQKKSISENKKELITILDNSLNTIQGLEAVLGKIDKELEDLGYFVKKWMSRTLTKRCGIEFNQFKMIMSEMHENLIKSKELIANQKLDSFVELGKKFPWYNELIKRLMRHLEECKKDAKGWMKNPEELIVALNELESRENDVNQFLINLKPLMDYV